MNKKLEWEKVSRAADIVNQWPEWQRGASYTERVDINFKVKTKKELFSLIETKGKIYVEKPTKPKEVLAIQLAEKIAYIDGYGQKIIINAGEYVYMHDNTVDIIHREARYFLEEYESQKETKQ